MLQKMFILLIILISNILSQKCVEHENFCKNCDSLTNLCSKCENDILIPDENGGCTGAKKCEVGENYCDECEENGNLCKNCEIGYFRDNNGGCSYTNNCEFSYKGECLKCSSDFTLIGGKNNFKLCKSLFSKDFKNCKKINMTNGLCDECDENYFLNTGDKKCSKIENCLESNYDFCKKCISGYYLDKTNNKCKKQENQFLHCKQTLNGKTCDKCDDDYFFDEEEKCANTNFCKKSQNFQCIECSNNYYLTGDKQSCSSEPNCQRANKETGKCSWCSDNYYLKKSDNKCISDEKQIEYKYCKLVSEKCEQCELGFQFGEDGRCTKTKDCAESENGDCIRCSDGYYLGLDRKCTNKEHCIYSRYSYCTECEDGYFWDNYNQICKLTNEKFKNCRISIEGVYCASCKKNYYLNVTDNLCYDNTQKNKFYKCSSVGSNNICQMCEEGYYYGYNDLKCSKIENCIQSEDENTCLKCKQYFCLDQKSGKCIDNEEILKEENKKYFRCEKTNKDGTKCEECEKGLVLNDEGLCINEKDCVEKNDNKCVRCENNEYTWRKSCLNNIFGCVNTFVDNCLRCDNIFNLKVCTECKEGFKLNEAGECK